MAKIMINSNIYQNASPQTKMEYLKYFEKNNLLGFITDNIYHGITNANNITDQFGIFGVSQSKVSNIPVSGILIHLWQHGMSWEWNLKVQVLFGITSGGMYKRACFNDGTWSNWTTIG